MSGMRSARATLVDGPPLSQNCLASAPFIAGAAGAPEDCRAVASTGVCSTDKTIKAATIVAIFIRPPEIESRYWNAQIISQKPRFVPGTIDRFYPKLVRRVSPSFLPLVCYCVVIAGI